MIVNANQIWRENIGKKQHWLVRKIHANGAYADISICSPDGKNPNPMQHIVNVRRFNTKHGFSFVRGL